MGAKIKWIFSAAKFWGRIIILFVLLISQKSFSQPNKQDLPTQRLLLKLSSCFLNVAKQNGIDIDSGLALASKRAHLNRMIVIERGFEDLVQNPANKWVANEDIRSAKQISFSGDESAQIRVLTMIGYYYVFQPAGRKNDLDSALVYLRRAKQKAEAANDPKSISHSLCGIGKCYLELGNLSVADSIFTEAINQSRKSNDKGGEATALDYWGTYSPFQPGMIAVRIGRLKKAETIYEQTNDRENRINTLANIGYLSFAAGKIEEAKQSFLDALALEKMIGFPYTQYSTFMLALSCTVNGDHINDLKYAMDEVKTAEATKDSIALAYFYASRANADLLFAPTTGRQEVMEWGGKSLAEFKRLGGDPAMYLLANNMANYLLSIQREPEAIALIQDLLKKYPPDNPIDKQAAFLTLGNAYRKQNPQQAEKYFLAAVKLQKETEAIRGDLGAYGLYAAAGTFYFQTGDFKKSKFYLNKALSYPTSNSPYASQEYVQDYLARIDSASGNFKDAYDHLRKSKILHDEGLAKITSKQVDELRIQYESGKKDKDIEILNQQATLQKLQIKQDQFTKNVMIAGAALLLLFLGLLYNRYRLKQKNNKQLELQGIEITQKNKALQHLVKEKEWLIKEVHHRVKNNLHTIICLLESQASYLENDALKAIENSQHRIYAMSLIHQKLYQSEDIKTIDMSVYVPEFVQYLKDSFGISDQVNFQLEIEPLQVGISQAIPIGLIINEAITNSIKYAFPDKRVGTIEISMHKVAGQIQLTIADNGIGIDTSLAKASSDATLGLELMKGLSGDIDAHIIFENDHGTRVRIVFDTDSLNDNPIVSTIKEKQVYT